MKWFISSDIHGFYYEWMRALEEAGFDINNKNHGIIVCGDLLDRGEYPIECLDFVNNMYDKNRAILIRGNHEDLLEEVFNKGYFERHDDHNGTIDTCCKLAGYKKFHLDKMKLIIDKASKNKKLKKYLSHLVDYKEIGNNIFVHGWIPLAFDGYDMFYDKVGLHYDPDWRKSLDWSDARWYNGMFQWSQGNGEKGKTIWCGHWHASYGNSHYHNDGLEFLRSYETFYIDPETGRTEPHENHHTFKDEGIVALDACTVHSHFVNVEILEV